MSGKVEGFSLSMVGKITLAQSVISSLLIFTMQIALFPVAACDVIEK